jgi:Leucine-rich repeat (LRR) protein
MPSSESRHSQWQACIPEVLSLTFLCGVPPKWPKDVAWPVLQVCSSWRKAAIATPQLWTTIDFNIDDLQRSSADSLECWLLRRGRGEIHLDVSLRSHSAELKHDRAKQGIHNERLSCFESLLFARAYAWRNLFLDDLPKTMVDILHPRLLSRATKLEFISISMGTGYHTRSIGKTGDAAVNIPNLKLLHLEDIQISFLPRFRAPELTTLLLSDCQISALDFIGLATNMPALGELHFEGISPITGPEHSLHDVKYTCASLRSLTFRNNFEISQVFFETLCRNAPSLEELYMENATLELLGPQPETSSVTFPFLRFVNSKPDYDPTYTHWGYIVDRSKSLHTLDTAFSDIAEFPEAFPAGLLHLKLALIRDSDIDFDSFEVEYVTKVLESLRQLETLTLIWSYHSHDTEEISFTPFLQVLTSKSPCGSFICPRLHSLYLYDLSIDENVLIETTRIRTELWGDLQSSTIDSGSKDNHDNLEFTVTLKGCFLLPEIQDASYDDLRSALDHPDRIVPPYNAERNC